MEGISGVPPSSGLPPSGPLSVGSTGGKLSNHDQDTLRRIENESDSVIQFMQKMYPVAEAGRTQHLDEYSGAIEGLLAGMHRLVGTLENKELRDSMTNLLKPLDEQMQPFCDTVWKAANMSFPSGTSIGEANRRRAELIYPAFNKLRNDVWHVHMEIEKRLTSG